SPTVMTSCPIAWSRSRRMVATSGSSSTTRIKLPIASPVLRPRLRGRPETLLHHLLELWRIKRLEQVSLGALGDSLSGLLLHRQSRDHHHRQVGMAHAGPPQHLKTANAS